MTITGVARGRSYTFVPFQPAVAPTVTLTETGPIQDSGTAGPNYTDVLGPSQGVEADGSGHVDTAKNGRSGSVNVSLPQGDKVSGTWACGTSNDKVSSIEPVLLPATVPPVVPECWQVAADSSFLPSLQCTSGALNIAAWDAYQLNTLPALGPNPTLTQVQTALCHDNSQVALGTSGMEAEYGLASLYYGWHFNLAPASVVAGARCGS